MRNANEIKGLQRIADSIPNTGNITSVLSREIMERLKVIMREASSAAEFLVELGVIYDELYTETVDGEKLKAKINEIIARTRNYTISIAGASAYLECKGDDTEW